MHSAVNEKEESARSQGAEELDWAPYPPIKLSIKQRAFLKALGHSLKPVVRIGQDGISEPVIGEIRQQILCHELIKVKWSSLSKEEGKKKLQAEELAARVGAHFVHLIGQIVLLYREAEPHRLTPPKAKKIQLPD